MCFLGRNPMHIQLLFDGLIHLMNAYCGRESDSGMTAQTQYLIL